MQYDEKMLEYITGFLSEIGIEVIEKELDENCILPGLKIFKKSIQIDKKLLRHAGDLLHEAGHIAMTPKEQLPLIGTDEVSSDWPSDGDEIGAILWSYAALSHLNLDADIVFHKEGYKNESDWIINQFEQGNYMGLPLLEWMGLCNSNETNGNGAFPKMVKWLR